MQSTVYPFLNTFPKIVGENTFPKIVRENTVPKIVGEITTFNDLFEQKC